MQLSVNGTVISSDRIHKATLPGTSNDPNDPKYKKRILCEGDSWFSLSSLPSSNMLFPLTFAEPTILYNLAFPGDTIIEMSDMAKNPDLIKNICDPNFAVKWDLIFLSGGGNDLMNRADKVLQRLLTALDTIPAMPEPVQAISFSDALHGIDQCLLQGFR